MIIHAATLIFYVLTTGNRVMIHLWAQWAAGLNDLVHCHPVILVSQTQLED